MYTILTFKQFLDNPMGKGSTAIPSRNLIKEDLNRRFHTLIEKKKIEFTSYKQGDDYYFHFLIPSESERKNTYDVVIQFTPNDDSSVKSDKNISNYYVKFFSNSPSFTYTYAYTFNLYGILIEWLGKKYNKKVIEQPPVTRNLNEIVSFEKSIYFALLYLSQNNQFLTKSFLDSKSKKLDKKLLFSKIRNEDQIKLEILKEKRRVEKEKKENEKSILKGKNVIKKDEKKVESKPKKKGINKIEPMAKKTARKSSINKIKPR